MTSQDQRPSTNRTASFTGLKPLILAKTSSSSSPRQPSLTNKSRKANNGVLGYGGNDASGLASNIQSQRRSVSARQPHNQMTISYQLLPGMESDLGLEFSPSTLQLSFTSPSANNRNRRTRSETFKFPLPPTFDLDNQLLSLTNNQARYQNLDFSSDASSSRESSPNLRSNHHRRQVVISQSWKNDVQSWINEKSPSDLISGVSWSDVDQEKERIRLHLEAQAQLGGRQGWSPETESSCSFPSQPIGLGFESEEIPSVTAPLFSSKPISLKHRDSQDTVASSIRSWAFSTAAANSDSSDKISLAPPSYSSNSESTNGSQAEKQSQVVPERRRRSNSIFPPAYADDESQSQSPEKEAQEYPFPLMDASLNNEGYLEDGDVEDEEKLRRLNQSFLLLGQPELEEIGDDEEKDAQLPREGLGNLSPFVNPFTLRFDSNREFTAPSLAEQMAYACGSGMGYLSADEEEKLGWEARGVRSQIKQDQEVQSSEEEDAYIHNEERAEIESSWSAGGEGIQSWDQVESEDEIFWRSSQSPQEMANHSSKHSSSGRYRLSQGLGRSGALRRNPTSASLRTLSVLSGSSTSSSPILSGVLAAPRPRAVTYGYHGERSPIDIDTLFSRPLSLEIEQGEKFGKEESSHDQVEKLENEEDCLLNDFAYLLDDSVSDFKAPEVEVLKSSMTVPSDLNTIIQPSPALSTPSLNLLQTPEMLSSLPSPLPKGGRKIEGLPSFASCPAFPFQSSSPAPEVEAAEAEADEGIPPSISTSSNLSILDRPRPFSRCDLGNDYIQIQKKIKRPTSSFSRNVDSPSNLSVNSSSSSRLLPSTSSPDIPIRRSSFEERRPELLVESSSSQVHNSPTAYFEETRKALVNEDAKLKVDLEELVNSRRKSQVQIQVPAPSPSVAAASSSSKATSSGRKGLLRNKLSVAALRGLVSSEKETKKPVTSVAMKPLNSSDSNATSSYSVHSHLTSVSKPKSILSSSSSSKTQSSRSSQPVVKGSELDAIRRSCADKTAFIKAAAIRAQNQANYPESIHSSSSRSSASSSSSTSTRPSIQSNDSNLSKTSSYSSSSISSSLSLPTLCVARTPSQRQRGETGLPETTRSKFSSDEEILKKKLNVDGKGVTIGLARTKSGRVREVKVEDDRRLPERLKEFKQARRISQVKALVQGNPGEDRTLPLPPPPKGILVLEESSKEVVQVMVKF